MTVGIDVGTTSVKALAVDASGRVVSRARVRHELIVPAPDVLEHDPRGAWCEGPRRALAALGGPAPDGIGICAMVPSIAAFDDRLRPLSPAPLYGDRRARNSPGAGGSPLDPADGRSPLDSREGANLLRWVREGWPGAHGYWPAQAAAAAALGGEPALDVFAAMAFYPAFDGVAWSGDADRLPRVVADPGAQSGRVGTAALAAPTADTPAEQIVTGATEPGEAFVIGGATLITWAIVEGHVEAPGLWTLPASVPGRSLIGGPSNAGGLFLDWARRLFAAPEGRLDPWRVPIWLPYVRGERTPLHAPSRRAGLHDLDLTHDAAAVRRAAYEAAGFVVRHHLDLAGSTPERITVSGGATRDPDWLRALADCTGAVIEPAAVPEGAALGAAWLARMAAGLERSLDDARRWARTGEAVHPDPRWTAACARRYDRFRALTAAA